MAARVGSGWAARALAAPAVSPADSVARPSRRRVRRHWPRAMGMEATVRMSSSRAPRLAISWKRIGLNRSPMIFSPELGSRWCTSPTRPAMEFSTGIMPRAHSPLFTASKASSKVGRASGS